MNQDLHGYYIEDLSVGMSASYARTVTEADVTLFAGLSGDDNPMHVNEEFAAETMFNGRIAHGMFSAALISAVLGTRLPGPGSIYITQFLKFKAPVRIGETITATATVKEVDTDRRRVTLETMCTVKGKLVVDGEAVMMVNTRP